MHEWRRRAKRGASVPATDKEYWTIELVSGVRIWPCLLPNLVLSGFPKTGYAFGHRWTWGWILTPLRVSLDTPAQGSADPWSVEQVSSSSSLGGCVSALPWCGGGGWERWGGRGNSSLSPPLHSLVSLVTAITKGRSALGDTDLSQPTKPESCRLLTSPWGLGVTAHSLPGTVPLEMEGCTFSTKSGGTDFFQLKNCDYILGLFLAILDPWLQSLPFCVLLFVIESIDVYLIHLAPQFVTRHCFPAFCHLFSQLPSLS